MSLPPWPPTPIPAMFSFSLGETLRRFCLAAAAEPAAKLPTAAAVPIRK